MVSQQSFSEHHKNRNRVDSFLECLLCYSSHTDGQKIDFKGCSLFTLGSCRCSLCQVYTFPEANEHVAYIPGQMETALAYESKSYQAE